MIVSVPFTSGRMFMEGGSSCAAVAAVVEDSMGGKGESPLLVRDGRRTRFIGCGDSVLGRENLRAWRTTGSMRKDDIYWLMRFLKVEVDQVRNTIVLIK